MGRAIEGAGAIEGARVARITLEILRPIPIAPLTVNVAVVRGGRTVELVEAVLSDERSELIRARAWRNATSPVDLSGAAVEEEASPPGPDTVEDPKPFFPTGHEVGYHAAMEVRFVRGGFLERGPATAWMRMRHPLVAGEQPSPLVRVLTAADSGNGISGALDYRTHLFVNTDLSVNLLRPPAGEWICLDSTTLLDPDGVGLADTALHDEAGRIGRATQSLVVAERRTNGRSGAENA